MEDLGLGYYFKLINDKLKVNADLSLKAQGLTFSQSRVLAYITQSGGKVTQKNIEEYLQVSHPTIVGIVSRMEQNGFLETHVDESDRRNKVVRLTEKAQLTAQFMTESIADFEKKLTATLSDQEIAELNRLLLVVINNLQ